MRIEKLNTGMTPNKLWRNFEMNLPNQIENVTGYDLFFTGDERLVDVMKKIVEDDADYPVTKSLVDNPVNGTRHLIKQG